MQLEGGAMEKATMDDCRHTEARYVSAGASARGFVRRKNQDRYRISGTGVVLCDGIGGADAGEVFAEASCWRCDRLLATSMGADEILADANDKVTAMGDALGGKGGSSVCVAKFHSDGCVDISSRGDVLAVRLSGDMASALNEPDYVDGCLLETYLGDGAYDERSSQRHRVLSLDRLDECLVFMSDGIWKSVALGEIADAWQTAGGDIEKMALDLVALAGRYGSLDDRTAVVCRRVA